MGSTFSKGDDVETPQQKQEAVPAKLENVSSTFKSSQVAILDAIHRDSSEDFNSDSFSESDPESDNCGDELGSPKESDVSSLLKELNEKYVELRHSVLSSNSPRGAMYSSKSLLPALSPAAESVREQAPLPTKAGESTPSVVWECDTIFESKFNASGKHRVAVNQYLLEKRLGQGSFGKTWRAMDLLTQSTVAIKILDKAALKSKKIFLGPDKPPTNEFEVTVKNEILIMKSMWHPNVVNLLEILDGEDKLTLYLVLEFVSGGTVCTLKGEPEPCCEPFEIEVIRKHMRGIVAGLEYLHLNNVFHSDLKPDNILLKNDGSIKISDFGTSRIIKGNTAREYRGTLAFSAPEIEEEEFSWRPCDIWAIGVIYYVFLFGKLPFNGGISEISERIQKDDLKIWKDDLSKPAMDLLFAFLKKKPAERITMSELKKHPFLRKDDFTFSSSDNASFGLRKLETRSFAKETLEKIELEINDMEDILQRVESSDLRQ